MRRRPARAFGIAAFRLPGGERAEPDFPAAQNGKRQRERHDLYGKVAARAEDRRSLAGADEDDQLVPIFAEVNSVAWTKINAVLVNTGSHALGVGKIALLDAH